MNSVCESIALVFYGDSTSP